MPLTGFTYTAGGTTVNPVFEQNADMVFEESEDRELLTYVRRCTNKFVFKGADFDFFYDNYEVSGICDNLAFQINYNNAPFYTGILKLGTERTEYDIDNCTMYASLDPSGDFVCLKDNWEDEINILSSTTKRTVETFFGTLTELTCGPVSGAAPIEIDSYFIQNVSGCLTGAGAWSLKRAYIDEVTPGTLYNHSATFVSEQVTMPCSGGLPVEPPGDNWVLITDNCPTNALYGRAPQMNYVGRQEDTTLKYYDNLYEVAGGSFEEIDNGVLLSDILTTKKPSCITSIVSDFFGINPSGDAPANTAYTEATENLQDVVVFQKSDVKRPSATQNAFNGEWTYKELLQSLKAQYNIKWRPSSGTLRIEHVSFFSRAQGLDLTTATYLTFIQGFHRYQYDGAGAAKRELFNFMETTSQLFKGLPILYSNCTTDDSQDATIDFGRVNNDVGYIQSNTDQVDDDGFVFVAAYESGGAYYFVSEGTALGGDLLLNGHMSIPNLQENYHVWDRPLPEGNMNNQDVTFETSVKRKKQVELSIRMRPDVFATFDANELVKTQIGWGEVDSLRYSAKSCTLTLRLRHG